MKSVSGKPIFCASVAVAALVAAPAVARADDAPDTQAAVTESATATVDSVVLRSNAGSYRGHVSEIVPGDHVMLVLETGESRSFAWKDVERVVVASTAAAGPPAPVGPPPMVGPRARVHVKAPHPSFLYRRAAGATEFVSECASPCDVELPIGDTYKVGGSGFSTTNEFKLDAAPGGSVEVAVDGPNWAGIVGGGSLAVVGGATAYVGILFALRGTRCAENDNRYVKRLETDCFDNIGQVGVGMMAVGTAALALGLLIVYPSLKTDMSQQKERPSKDAFVRKPAWRTASVGEAGAAGTFPLVYEGRF
jgi:hypothetical protein